MYDKTSQFMLVSNLSKKQLFKTKLEVLVLNKAIIAFYLKFHGEILTLQHQRIPIPNFCSSPLTPLLSLPSNFSNLKINNFIEWTYLHPKKCHYSLNRDMQKQTTLAGSKRNGRERDFGNHERHCLWVRGKKARTSEFMRAKLFAYTKSESIFLYPSIVRALKYL